jgi:DNA replication licensing factor MCM2
MTFARDHEELLAFILGQMVKDRVRMYQAQHYEQPDHVTVKVSDLDAKVSRLHPP